MKVHRKLIKAYKALQGHFPGDKVIFYYKGYGVKKNDFSRVAEYLRVTKKQTNQKESIKCIVLLAN